VEAGLSSASIFALYKPLTDKNYSRISGIVSASKQFYYQAGGIFIILAAALSCLYPLFIHSTVLGYWRIMILVLVLSIGQVVNYFAIARYQVLLTADQKSYVISIISMVQLLLNLCVVVVLGYMRADIVLMRLLCSLSVLIAVPILRIYCTRKYPYVDYHAAPIKSALDQRWSALYLQVLGSIQTAAPITILTFVIGNLKLVSVYAVFNIVFSGLVGVINIFSGTLYPSFGELLISDKNKQLKNVYSEFETAYYYVITIVYGITSVMIMPFIKVYTRHIVDVNYMQYAVGCWFVVSSMAYALKTPQGMMVISAGRFKSTQSQTTIQGVLMVLLGVIFTIKWGIVGVLVASAVSNG
jgi:O-antigen/teichoic acid export membrane protein